MRIIVQDPADQNVNLRFPTGLLLNRLTAHFAARMLQKYGLHLTGRQLSAFMRELKRWKRRHKDWVLVEVDSADGEYIQIRM